MSESRLNDDLDINVVDDDRLGMKAQPRKKRLILVAASLILLTLIAGTGYLAIHKGWFSSTKQTAEAADPSTAQSTILAVPSIISSLDNGENRPVYVKMTTRVEIAGIQNEASLRRYIPQIQDIFQTYLHETRPQEIRGNGVYRLRETLLRRLRIEIAPLKITNFYITEFLIQ
ncbi:MULTISPECIES: flagellar basal body-associated FliL family protein [Asaia]|uniref:Flagellar protein FliL n=1 Tax=Asaia bogorensis TaxID=91915 RepID=A0A060QL86_9PROT|nr:MULTISPECIES: flagellar basal body-associated FliL family protein [Asaia]ETC97168.1 flagellar basal body-associated protein FliL [Asaia sp. SF2.1]CDG40556.1 Flagellar FliL protein [Asaia bogorensis]